jgi:succinate-semialdehyde dehydrogenase/glutarate-semialdehyde dehydrogenase
MANNCKYGLGASLWTKDKRKGEQMAQRINGGSVGVNAMALTYGAPEAPRG